MTKKMGKDQYRSSSRSESLLVLGRGNESLNHFRVDEVTTKLIQLRQPGIVAGEVQRRFGRIGRVASEISEVLHQDEGAVEVPATEFLIFHYCPQRGCARLRTRVKSSH